ncbi:MAG: hypothetical protein R3Y32_06780 [Bacillota bacterium]
MLLAIISISYILAINIFGFRIVKIQRADRLKNGQPTPQPTPIKQLESNKKEETEKNNLKSEKEKGETTKSETVATAKSKTTKKENEKAKTATATATHPRPQSQPHPQPQPQPQPHNGDKLQKDTILAEEKLNFKRYERIPDLKIMLVAIFGGALGEYLSFLLFKYRTTNTILMVALPVLTAVWVYLYFILIGGVFIV